MIKFFKNLRKKEPEKYCWCGLIIKWNGEYWQHKANGVYHHAAKPVEDVIKNVT